MNFFIWIYEFFYYELLSADEIPQLYMAHEFSLIMTYIALLALLLGSLGVLKTLARLFKLNGPKRGKR